MRRAWATRPVFMPGNDQGPAVHAHLVRFEWFPGLALAQRQRCIFSLHQGAAARIEGLERILEVSTRSRLALGRRLSAFNLALILPGFGAVTVENAYQCAKVYDDAGPFPELLDQPPAHARKALAAHTDKPLRGFRLLEQACPVQPTTLFYDWLYARALCRQPALLRAASRFQAFTDIAFNPARSSACQAMALARVLWLFQRDRLASAMACPQAFRDLAHDHESETRQSELPF